MNCERSQSMFMVLREQKYNLRDTGQKKDKHESHKQRELRQIVIKIPVDLFSDLDQTQIERGFHE